MLPLSSRIIESQKYVYAYLNELNERFKLHSHPATDSIRIIPQ